MKALRAEPHVTEQPKIQTRPERYLRADSWLSEATGLHPIAPREGGNAAGRPSNQDTQRRRPCQLARCGDEIASDVEMLCRLKSGSPETGCAGGARSGREHGGPGWYHGAVRSRLPSAEISGDLEHFSKPEFSLDSNGQRFESFQLSNRSRDLMMQLHAAQCPAKPTNRALQLIGSSVDSQPQSVRIRRSVSISLSKAEDQAPNSVSSRNFQDWIAIADPARWSSRYTMMGSVMLLSVCGPVFGGN